MITIAAFRATKIRPIFGCQKIRLKPKQLLKFFDPHMVADIGCIAAFGQSGLISLKKSLFLALPVELLR